MKIALNARVMAAETVRGWSRYTINLLDGLMKAGHEIFLFSDQPINQKWIPHHGGFCQVTLRSGRNYLDWEQRVLARLCDEHRIDVLHCPTNYGLPFFCKAKKVLTLHDAIERAFYGNIKSLRRRLHPVEIKLRALHFLSQKAADHIITVSEHAKRDIVENYRIAPDKISVIYEAADPQFRIENAMALDDIQKQFPTLRENYFFYVGGLEERKNISTLLKGWAQAKLPGFQLVIGGGKPDEIARFRAEAQILGLEVLFTGYVPESLLPSLYAHAQALVYPSFYEGFGLQIVEAMAMGTPVICSNAASLPEVLGDPDCLFDPRDEKQLAVLLRRMTEKDFRETKSRAVQAKGREFSWDRAARETIAIYERLIEL